MNQSPLVSICIPTYNSEKHIEFMLSSILLQTYKNIEVIICDNFSSDSTFEILQSYKHYNNWKISQNEQNIGAINNMAKLTKMASGKYVAIYHADDLYDRDIVKKSVKALEEMSNISLISTMGTSIDENNMELSVFNLPKAFEDKKSVSFELFFLEILSQRPFFLITPSIMTRAYYYEDKCVFNKRYKSSADYGMWFEILQHGDLHIINESLICYRTHDQQGTFLEIKKNCKIPDCIPLYEDYANKNKPLFWSSFTYTYYKLMLIQSIKLNNAGNFKKSQIFLRMILKRTKKYIFPWIILYSFINFLNIKFSLNNLLIIKNKVKK